MNKNNTIILGLSVTLSLLTLISCKKNVNCENAAVCVHNNTGHTVYYRWGYSSVPFEDTLLAGATTCTHVGEIHINHSLFSNSSQTTFADFFSNKGDINDEITDCHVTFELE